MRETSLTSTRILLHVMGFFNRLSRLVRANANAAVSGMEDPVKILDQSVADMQSDLVKLRQAVALAIASQKRLRNQAEQAETQSKTWYERAELALKKGEEDLAREALSRRKTFQETATSLNTQIQAQDGQVETLKKSLVALEGKIAQAKTKKDMLKARAQAAEAQQQQAVAVTRHSGRHSFESSAAALAQPMPRRTTVSRGGRDLFGADGLVDGARARLGARADEPVRVGHGAERGRRPDVEDQGAARGPAARNGPERFRHPGVGGCNRTLG